MNLYLSAAILAYAIGVIVCAAVMLDPDDPGPEDVLAVFCSLFWPVLAVGCGIYAAARFVRRRMS